MAGLVTGRPHHKVRLLQVLRLVGRSARLDEFNSLLRAAHNCLVHALSVAAEACERIKKAIFVGKLQLFVVGVAVLLRLVHASVENSDAVAVQNRDVSLAKVGQTVVVDTPVRVLEKAVAATDASAGTLALFLRLKTARTAPATVLYSAHRCSRKSKLACVPQNVLHCRHHVRVVQNVSWPIQQNPSS